MKKRICVCIATFNGELYIEEQLLSIISQMPKDSEIIISDDHSTDKTLDKIIALKDNRIRIVINDKPAGPVNNFENALEHATGDIIFIADQDDVWAPDKVSVIMPLMDSFDLVLSDALVTDQSGNVLYPSFFKVNRSENGFIRNWVNNSFMGCCMVFNRRILDYVLPFPAGIAMHDMWIGLNASLFGRCCFLDQPLVYYRRHGKNVIGSFSKTRLPVRRQIKIRTILLFNIIRRGIERKFKI